MRDRDSARTALWVVGLLVGVACTKVAIPEPPPAPPPPPAPTVAVARPTTWSPSRPTAAPRPAAAPVPAAAAVAVPARQDAGIATLNGDPNGLKQVDLQKVLNGTLPSLASCFAAGSGSGAGLTFDADPSGHARNVKVTGVNAETERCVSSIVSGVRLPDFQGAAVPVQFPLSIYRPAAAPIAAPVAPPAPAAAPVFIKP